MIFGQDRSELRSMYSDAWQKARTGQMLGALESQIVSVIREHPEYLPVIEDPDLSREFQPEGGRTNPFLHLGLHLALRDQVATDRPPGIRAAYNAIAARMGGKHAAEHRLIECLAETLWEAQRDRVPPDEQAYLARVRRL